MDTTKQAVACRWCHAPGVEICPDTCQPAETIAIRYLKNIGKLTPETLRQAMAGYLASRPSLGTPGGQDADRPAPPEPRPFRVCPNCGAEPVIKPAWECWQCGHDARG